MKKCVQRSKKALSADGPFIIEAVVDGAVYNKIIAKK